MAIGYNASSIIGGPLDQDVLKQLEKRQELYTTRTGRNNTQLLYLNSKTGWVKLSSSVNSNGSATLAKNNILFGGSFKENSTTPKSGINFNGVSSNTAYNKYESMGVRPMPGITNFRIDSKNRFGTLREATVDFQAWSVEQLTDLEQLYLRPGFTVLLEWGHSMYLTNSGRVETMPPSTVENYFTDGKSKEKVVEEIKKYKKESNQNYDAVFGYIKNFVWSYRTDGGYDCKLTIISAGELIESVQVALSPSQSGEKVDEKSAVDKQPEVLKTAITNFLEIIQSTPDGDQINKNLEEKAKVLFEGYKKESGLDTFNILRTELGGQIGPQEESNDQQLKSLTHIRIGDLLALVNVAFLLEDQLENKLFKFSLEEDKSLFLTFSEHIALDPKIAFIPKESKLNYILGPKIQAPFEAPSTFTKGERGSSSILNIYLEIGYVLKILDTVNNQSPSQRTVVNFIESLLNGLSSTLGEINEFGLHYEEEEFLYYLVDRRLTPNKSDLAKSLLNITGLKSTVTNISLSSKLSPNIASMIAISAQASNTDVGQDVENMFRWNQGLEDRIVKKRNIKTQEALEVKKNNVLNSVVILSRSIREFNNSFNYNVENINGLKNVHKEVMQYLVREATNSSTAGPAGIIPFDLDITLDGIGGVKIGQAFTLNEGILPEKYNGVVGFLITGVSHVVQNNKWNTDLKAQTIIIGKRSEGPLPKEDGLLSSGAIESAISETREVGNPDIPFKIIDKETVKEQPAFPETFGREISLETLLGRLNSDSRIQEAFRGFFDHLFREYQQYKVEINATFRSLERSFELKYDDDETYYDKGNAEPGSSAHNYAAALDMNLVLPSGTRLRKRGDLNLWEVSQIADIASQYGIRWGGYFNGNEDAVHFDYAGFNYRKLGENFLADLGAQSEESSDFPLTVIAPDGRPAANWIQYNRTFTNMTSPAILKSGKIFEQLDFTGSETEQEILNRLRQEGVNI